MTAPIVVADRRELASLFSLDPAIHVYGLSDLEDRFWDHSTWWRRGDAVVGRVRLPGEEGVIAVYAISPRAPAATNKLLAELSAELPAGALVLAPLGADDVLAEGRAVTSFGTHIKMTVDAESLVTPGSGHPTRVLGRDDLSDLEALYGRDPGAAYFLPAMLDDGIFVGIHAEDRLVAAGGTHGLSLNYRVAAVGGIITAPDVRGLGHGGQITAVLSRMILDRGLTVGLNVKTANTAAIRVYERLGYREIHRYVEFELDAV